MMEDDDQRAQRSEEHTDSPPGFKKKTKRRSISHTGLLKPKGPTSSSMSVEDKEPTSLPTSSKLGSSYTLPKQMAASGRVRYLKPDEISSGRCPTYDFVVIVNRSVTLPTGWSQWWHAWCRCTRSSNTTFHRLCPVHHPLLRESEDEHRRIVQQLCAQGLMVDVLDGGHANEEMHAKYFILLLRASDAIIHAYVRHFRDQLWMEHGAIMDLEQDLIDRSAPPTPAERIQIVDYIVKQRVYLSMDDVWIHDMFPMHDHHVTDQLLSKWIRSIQFCSSNTSSILNSLRFNFGEKVTYYFAFITFYNRSLIPIAILGVLLQILHGMVSTTLYMRILPFWGIGVSVVWSFTFLKSWDHQNAVLQYEWNKKLEVKQIEYPNHTFYGEERVNSLTGEVEVVYPSWRRLPKYCCVVLFMVLQMIIMLVLVAIWITIYEILKAKYPTSSIFSTQWFLILLEGIVFGIFVDVIQWNIVVTKMGKLFTHWENYRTEDQYEKALIRKLFLLDFLNYYTWFFSLAFVFVIPNIGDYLMNTLNHTFFGDAMNCCFGPYVDQHGTCITCPLGPKEASCIECVGYFTFDRHHVDLSAMFVTPIVVTQTLNIALGVIAPVLVRMRRERAQEAADVVAQKRVMEAGSMKILGSLEYEGSSTTSTIEEASHFGNKSHARYLEYTPTEIEVLNKKAREVLFESEQDTYDPYQDFHALTVQYGFTVMFSILWPLMPMACFIINTLKRRTDGYRLCKTLKRPIPRKANGIAGWRGIFTVYAYVAVIVNVLLICISTGSLEFYDRICIRDIENQLRKRGKTLDDFIFGPDFGCLHVSWRLLVILIMEHVLICGVYIAMTRIPKTPAWIIELVHAREKRFKQVLRTNENMLFGASGSSRVEKQTSGTTTTTGLSTLTIDVNDLTPLSEPPSSNGLRTESRNYLAQQWSEDA